MCRANGRASAEARSRRWPGLPYAETAARSCSPSSAIALTTERCGALTRRPMAASRHEAVTPLVQLDERHWLLELFHGPTLAFKDVALQLLGLLFEDSSTARRSI